MNNKILEPDTSTNSPQAIPLHEVVPAFTNYEALSNALRQDMRDASKELLKLHKLLTDAMNAAPDFSFTFRAIRVFVEEALSALDCYDYLEQENNEIEQIPYTVTIIASGDLRSVRVETIREAKCYIAGVRWFSDIEWRISQDFEPVEQSDGFVEARKSFFEAQEYEKPE